MSGDVGRSGYLMSSLETLRYDNFRLREGAGEDDTGDDGGAVIITIIEGRRGGRHRARERTWEDGIVVGEQEVCGGLCEALSPSEDAVETGLVGVVISGRLLRGEVLLGGAV